MKTAYAVVGAASSDDFVTTKESRRFPEMPALPSLVSSTVAIGIMHFKHNTIAKFSSPVLATS
jgi:hypothetical protein